MNKIYFISRFFLLLKKISKPSKVHLYFITRYLFFVISYNGEMSEWFPPSLKLRLARKVSRALKRKITERCLSG